MISSSIVLISYEKCGCEVKHILQGKSNVISIYRYEYHTIKGWLLCSTISSDVRVKNPDADAKDKALH